MALSELIFVIRKKAGCLALGIIQLSIKEKI